jgi:hypothetical protein
MNNFTPEDAAALNELAEAGLRVYSVVYNPNTVTGTPEADAIAAGMVEYYREDSANLVEVIYTLEGDAQVSVMSWSQISSPIEVPAGSVDYEISLTNVSPTADVVWSIDWTGDNPADPEPQFFTDPDNTPFATLHLEQATSDLWVSPGRGIITATINGVPVGNSLVIFVTPPKESLEPDVFLYGIGTLETFEQIPTIIEILVGTDSLEIPLGVSEVYVNGIGGYGEPERPPFSDTNAQWPAIVAGDDATLVFGDDTAFRNAVDITSPTDWETITRPAGDWRCAIYGGGLFVAFPRDNNVAVVSDDNGTTWSSAGIATATNQSWEAAAYGDGLFVVLEPNGTRGYTSPDGLAWTEITVPNTNRRRMTFGDGKFVASGGGFTIVGTLSAGIITWATASTPLVNSPLGIMFGAGRFVLADNSTSNGYYSDDGIAWTAMTLPRDNWITGTYGGGRFIVGSNDTAGGFGAAYSADGITWTNSATGSGTRRASTATTNGFTVAMVTGGGLSLDITGDGGDTWIRSVQDATNGSTAYVDFPNETIEFPGGLAGSEPDPRNTYTVSLNPAVGPTTVGYEVDQGSYATLAYYIS